MDQYKFPCEPVAHEESTVQGPPYRSTLLDDKALRYEWAEDGRLRRPRVHLCRQPQVRQARVPRPRDRGRAPHPHVVAAPDLRQGALRPEWAGRYLHGQDDGLGRRVAVWGGAEGQARRHGQDPGRGRRAVRHGRRHHLAGRVLRLGRQRDHAVRRRGLRGRPPLGRMPRRVPLLLRPRLPRRHGVLLRRLGPAATRAAVVPRELVEPVPRLRPGRVPGADEPVPGARRSHVGGRRRRRPCRRRCLCGTDWCRTSFRSMPDPDHLRPCHWFGHCTGSAPRDRRRTAFQTSTSPGSRSSWRPW